VLIIALRNLLHDKTQFTVAVIGVSLILLAGQIGVFPWLHGKLCPDHRQHRRRQLDHLQKFQELRFLAAIT
jgi:hypothetical protein